MEALPCEVLLEIFERALPTSGYMRVLVSIFLVCRRFYATASRTRAYRALTAIAYVINGSSMSARDRLVKCVGNLCETASKRDVYARVTPDSVMALVRKFAGITINTDFSRDCDISVASTISYAYVRAVFIGPVRITGGKIALKITGGGGVHYIRDGKNIRSIVTAIMKTNGHRSFTREAIDTVVDICGLYFNI